MQYRKAPDYWCHHFSVNYRYIPPLAVMLSFLVAMICPLCRAVTVTCHIPPEPRSPWPSYIPAPLSVLFTTVFIAAIFIEGIAGMKNVTVTSAPEIGCPAGPVNLTWTLLVPFCAGDGSVVNVMLGFFCALEGLSCARATRALRPIPAVTNRSESTN